MFFKSLFNIFGIILLLGFIFLKSEEFFTQNDLTSPVLGVLGNQVSENIWIPKLAPDYSNQFEDAPVITATSTLFIESNSGQVLYAKNPQQELPIASLVKIMTTIIALENHHLNDIFQVSQQAADMEPDKMMLKPGEKLTLRELLEGIFLVSANDAAEVIAQSDSRGQFINLMNRKARMVGMNNTFFLNPTGLEEEAGKQYSTVLDVAIMSRYLITKWPEIIQISSNPYVYIEANSDHQDYEMYSGINLLTTYPGVLGLKTGYTPEAGLTLVTLARRGDKEVIGVLLGSVNRRDDAKLMLDYSFKKLGIINE